MRQRQLQLSCRAGFGLVLVGSGLLAALGCGGNAKHPTELGCSTLSNSCPAVVPSYANEVAPILAAHCQECHTRENPSGPWALDDPSDIADWGPAIRADLAECLMPPPEATAPLGEADRETLNAWLACGAPDN